MLGHGGKGLIERRLELQHTTAAVRARWGRLA